MVDGTQKNLDTGNIYPERGRKCDDCDMKLFHAEKLNEVGSRKLVQKGGQVFFAFMTPSFMRENELEPAPKQGKLRLRRNLKKLTFNNLYNVNIFFVLMKFEIDMSGCDIFWKECSVIGISDYNGMIRGFQLNQELVDNLKTNWKNGKYFCKYSKRRLGFFKAMVYSAIICGLFESIKNPISVDIEICRDFRWHENNIEQRLKKLLKKKLNIRVNSIKTHTLPKNCDIDNYVYLMFKDKYNLLPTYVDLSLEDIEKFLL